MRQPRRHVLTALGIVGVFALAACGDAGYPATYVENRPTAGAYGQHGAEAGGSTGESGATIATGKLVNAQGGDVGTVTLSEGDAGINVVVNAHGLEPGFKGLHVHSVGKCEGQSAAPDNPSQTGAFLSAGGHLAGQGAQHGQHAGDLPSLLVGDNGNASLTTNSNLTSDLLFDRDGSALVVHSGPDNFANVPQRYAANGPDQETKNTGDSGTRVACAVLEQTQGAGSGEATAGAGH
ncbi:superoxide dismutase family protein [Piscicoccus intestinalis]|uniref:superoxide dismutase family protein n=1 Tax=Piscicoccus intestinalis TaxID=746033 RepID=UPI0008398054|nr:superoxide dismutase family protein [Piscicoccus intestinalis]